MTSVRRAVIFSFIERYVFIVLTLAGSMIVARLLAPEEIGIYSVSLAVIGIAQVVRDFGIGNFLIQKKDLSVAHIQTAFGVALLIGAILFGVVVAATPFVASFYGDERLLSTLGISALNFLVLPFCTISLAMLKREMAFDRLLVVSLIAAIVSFVCLIGFAYAGFGPNSMAIAGVLGNLVTGVCAWVARGPEGRLLLPRFSEWREVLNFGAQSSATSVVTSISVDVNDLALGKILGFAPVAIISRAQGLMNLFHRDLMQAVRGVALPVFAKAFRAGESVEDQLVRSVAFVTVFAWPFYGFVALFPLEILRLLFGPQWDAAVPLVPIFALAGALAACGSLITTAFLAVGRIDLVTKSELLFQPARASLIVFVAWWSRSLEACAIAYLATFVVYVPYIYWFKQKCLPTDWAGLASLLSKSLRIACLTLLGPFSVAIAAGFARSEPVSSLILIATGAVAGVLWVLALKLFNHPLASDPIFTRYMGSVLRFR
jgi:lipopolysaccharide exporter